MFKKVFLIFSFVIFANISFAAGGNVKLMHMDWHFSGPFGKFDRQSIQRGYQVYKEVCAACHSAKRVYFRNLQDVGFSELEVKALAAEYTVIDGPDDFGEMFERPARPSDHFVSPYPNDNAARAANGGAFPPDLSLIVKARPDGANYLYSLLNGYKKAPKGMKIPAGMYYNEYFPGHKIAMPVPLIEGQVDYMDGTEASVEQMSYDLVNFLHWTAEPEMEQRKRMGIRTLLFLIIATIFFYIAKKRIWARV